MPAGYSGTPLVKKLGLGPGKRAIFLHAPDHYAGLLGPLPEDLRVLSRLGTRMDFIHAFCDQRRVLERGLPGWKRALAPTGMLWISWAKKTSALAADLTGDSVRELGLAAGLVDVKVCAVDEDWSGLKFVVRTADRK